MGKRRHKTGSKKQAVNNLVNQKASAQKNKKGLADQFRAYGGINTGGYHNAASGAGTFMEKSRWSIYLPTLFTGRQELETIFNESWAAKRFISLAVEQMFMYPRSFTDLDDTRLKRYENYLEMFNLNSLLSRAMQAGRLYGSAYLVFITREAPLNEPLDMNELLPGDLKNILAFDRYSVTVIEREYDIANRNYQKPTKYLISPHYGRTFECHSSRVLRFDGQQPLSSDGWTIYDRDYGVSELIPAIRSIFQDAQISHTVCQIMEEASIPYLKSDYFRESNTSAPDAASPAQFAQSFNATKSNYNMMFLDNDAEIGRLEASLAGVANVMDRYADRLAAAGGYPITVFLGKSPGGLNATGESDLRNNSAKVASMQEHKLRPAYNFIDALMTRTCGIDHEFDFEFPSLMDDSEAVKAQTALTKAQTAQILIETEQATPARAAQVFDDDPIVGTIEPEFNFKKDIEKERDKLNLAGAFSGDRDQTDQDAGN